MEKLYDCIVCGSCVVDILVHPVPLERPIGGGKLLQVEPLSVTTGGIVSNAGITLARLGMRVAAFSYLGKDEWARFIRTRYEQEGVTADHLMEHPSAATSTTAVLIAENGERTFAHCVGAPKLMNRDTFERNMHVFRASRMVLFGYYSLMPNLEEDLPDVLSAMREVGCRTALDAAGEGGGLQPLDRILPHLDVYVPSRAEAIHQTGETDPRRIIDVYRQCGAPGLLGVKLGADGALLSPESGRYIEITQIAPPGPVIDTTGAGDCFYAGLLTGLLRGLSVEQAGRLAAATGACCVTGLGATTAIRDYPSIAHLAQIDSL